MYEIIYDQGLPVCVLRLTDGAFIPIAETNKDFIEFQEWNSRQDQPLDYINPLP
jgi:hypothetical protein